MYVCMGGCQCLDSEVKNVVHLHTDTTSPAVSGSPGSLSMPTIVSGTSGLGIKRPMNAGSDYQPPPATKKARGRAASVGDVSGECRAAVSSLLVNWAVAVCGSAGRLPLTRVCPFFACCILCGEGLGEKGMLTVLFTISLFRPSGNDLGHDSGVCIKWE